MRIKRLMTIGSPYNFNQDSTRYRSEMLSDFIRNRNKLPKNLVVYFVVGTKTYNSDGLVPAGSVLLVDIFIKALLNHLQRFRFLVQMLSIQVCRRMSRL